MLRSGRCSARLVPLARASRGWYWLGGGRNRRRVGDKQSIDSVHTAAAIDDAADRAGADRMEEAAHRLLDVRAACTAGPRTRLTAGVGTNRIFGGQTPDRLDPFDQHFDVLRVGQVPW